MVWLRQKELDQGSSAPDKPEGHTLDLTSGHPIRLRTDENKSHRGTKYPAELPPDLGFTQGYCARVQLPCYIEDCQLRSVF